MSVSELLSLVLGIMSCSSSDLCQMSTLDLRVRSALDHGLRGRVAFKDNQEPLTRRGAWMLAGQKNRCLTHYTDEETET